MVIFLAALSHCEFAMDPVTFASILVQVVSHVDQDLALPLRLSSKAFYNLFSSLPDRQPTLPWLPRGGDAFDGVNDRRTYNIYSGGQFTNSYSTPTKSVWAVKSVWAHVSTELPVLK